MGANGSGLPATRYCGFLIVDLYHRSRLHLSLAKDSPDSRSVQSVGRVIAFPEVGGLHHRYERVA
jgi:putative transposase